MSARRGEVVLEGASRWFEVRGDRGRTLKEMFTGAFGRGERRSGPPPVPALREVTLRVAPGETLGVVGRNGAGKTSTLNALAGIVPLHEGRAECGGRVVSLLELGAGFGRDFTGRENIYLNGALHGLTREEIESQLDAIVAFSELGDFIDVPVRTYSSGMFLRLGFAIAAHLQADVMLIDEVLAVGDEAFQRKCLARIAEQIAAGTTLVLVSHDPGAIERVCRRVVVLEEGRVAFDGPTAEGLLFYHRMMGTEHGGGATLRQPGTGPLAVADVEIQDGAGRRAELFQSGDSMRLVVELAAREPVPRPSLAVEVRDVQGRTVFRTATRIELSQTRAHLSFEIPRLALLGGDYDLALAVGEEDREVLDRVVRFGVAREPDAEGIVDLRGEWRAIGDREVVS